MVAGTTGNLCEAANALVQGGASEEKLVAAAMGVSKSTAQLLLACMVKADPNSDSARRLQVRRLWCVLVCAVCGVSLSSRNAVLHCIDL